MQVKKKFLPKILTLLIIVMLFILAVGITGVAAQSALPGDALYSLKTTIERTRLSISQDSGSRAELRMHFAEERLAEIESLIEEGRYSEVGDAVLAFESAINGAIIELETLAEVDPARASKLALDITAALTRYAQTLSAMADDAPEAVQDTVSRALDSTLVAGSLKMPSDDDSSDDDEEEDDSLDLNSNDVSDDISEDDEDDFSDNSNSSDDDEDDFIDNSNINSNDDEDDYNDNSNSSYDDDEDDYSNNSNSSDDDEDDDSDNSNSSSDDDEDDDSNNSNSSDDDDDDNSDNSNSSSDDDEDDYSNNSNSSDEEYDD